MFQIIVSTLNKTKNMKTEYRTET